MNKSFMASALIAGLITGGALTAEAKKKDAPKAADAKMDAKDANHCNGKDHCKGKHDPKHPGHVDGDEHADHKAE